MERIIFLPEAVKERRMSNHRHAPLPIIMLLLTMLILSLSPPVFATEKPTHLDLSTAITQVAKQNIPAVVHIEVTKSQVVSNPLLPFQNDPSFRQFFGNQRMPKKFKRELKGLGSGMIIDAQGHILTNNHVAGGASTIQVLLSNGNRYPAKLVGTDLKTDLAVIKITAHERLPFVTFADSDKVEVGQWVVAIGPSSRSGSKRHTGDHKRQTSAGDY